MDKIDVAYNIYKSLVNRNEVELEFIFKEHREAYGLTQEETLERKADIMCKLYNHVYHLLEIKDNVDEESKLPLVGFQIESRKEELENNTQKNENKNPLTPHTQFNTNLDNPTDYSIFQNLRRS